jgi:nifR3 family TIM-barrel protein
MKFREILQKNIFVSAPMAGFTSAPYRRLLRGLFGGIIYTEMTSAEGLARNNPGSREFLDMTDDCRPCVLQLFGGNPESYPGAVRFAEEYAAPDAYDINMGCPVRKVLKTGGGAALLGNLNTLKEIVRAVRGATQKEFSIKIRLGLDEKTLVYKEILAIAEGEGVNALAVHARTKRQMFGGEVHYDALAELAAWAKIPVIGNGSVADTESLARMKETGVAGVMIGRGALHAPWIFKALSEGKDPGGYLTGKEILALLEQLYDYMLIHAGENTRKKTHYLNVLKKFSVWFSKGLENASEFRTNIYKGDGEEMFFKTLREFFTVLPHGL